ncbi:sensor domain-containing phosphodiesterase [Alteribacillus iranensis]|uniref:EAL domain, c-di-GMP-specific phosphodiesterase class I (Or its enzymatically inactive variant) n=1 Tax=Alteribacillus iranensis TaxID=930128 RepID=A0A1I2DTH6_9BACI|nr:EAL domain-containing protein [Alteribacillus iranensis]SFE83220.1 EAL domain, c-di-GMP-specific phosphodiesterase class I (or its enzymatically inactive variant) [Alteribacillus iranensis]
MKVEHPHFHQDQTKIIQMISSGTSLRKILKFITTSMEKLQGSVSMYASIMLYHPLEKKLADMISTSLSKEFRKRMGSVDIGPYEGSCGTAAFFKRNVMVSNIEVDPLWRKYRHIAASYGYKACFSMPILSSKQKILGTMTVYYKKVHTPSEEMIKALEMYKRLAAIAVEIHCTGERVDTAPKKDKVGKKESILIGKTQNESILTQLRRALEKEEFEVYFQPYFGIEDNKFGIEALIRWNHPNSGLLPPAAFIEVAEETGFILDMEQWVLKKSLDEVSKLHQNGWKHLTLSVNISARQFGNDDFVEAVADLLQVYSFPASHLVLEVTERFIIERDNMEVLSKLRDIGVKISIDDFGTAYSSLHYLKDLPVDELKIDRSFIANMEKDINNQKIVEMIILLSRQLNVTTVAEGVETNNQLKILTDMRCDRVQGFLFSKPMPLREITRKYPEMRGLLESTANIT